MFETHKLNDTGYQQMKEFKILLSVVGSKAMAMMPECRERSLFKTKLEEAVFFGAKAIASVPENHSEVILYPESD